MQVYGKLLLPLIVIFFVFTIFIFFGQSFLQNYNIDATVLFGANLLYVCIGILVFFIQKNALQNSNPNVFIRSVILGMMIKMFSTVLAVLAYVVLVGQVYNKKAVFISLFMYLAYLATEVIIISKENKRNG